MTSTMKNQQQPSPLHDVPSRIPVAHSSSFVSENINITTEDETTKKYELNMLPRLKSKKKTRRKLLNIRKYDLLSPKTSFLVFSELFQGVQIKLQKRPQTFLNCARRYSATFKIDGQIYTAYDISMTLAREKLCEQFLSNVFYRKISEISGKKEKSSKKMKVGENSTVPISRWISLEESPTDEFSKLAIHNLINQWQTQNASKAFNRRTTKM